MQKGYFPTKNIKLTQGYGSKCTGQHKHSYALDLGGKYRPFAPFDCKVSNIYIPTKKGNATEVWLTSLEKIECANGICDYLTMSITHPAGIAKMKLGQVYKQFDDLNIPTDNMTGTYTGPHGHIELSLGTQAGWNNALIKKYGEYININAIKPEEYLYITEDTTIENDTYKKVKYNFVKDTGKTYTTGVYKCEYDMCLRSKPDRSSKVLKVKKLNDKQEPALKYKKPNDSAVFKKGTKYTVLEIVQNANGEYWAKTYSNAYICIDDGTTKYCTKVS